MKKENFYDRIDFEPNKLSGPAFNSILKWAISALPTYKIRS